MQFLSFAHLMLLEGGSTYYFSNCPVPSIFPGVSSDTFANGPNTVSVEYASCVGLPSHAGACPMHCNQAGIPGLDSARQGPSGIFQWLPAQLCSPVIPSPPSDSIPRSLTLLYSLPHANLPYYHYLSSTGQFAGPIGPTNWLSENEIMCQINKGIFLPFPSLSIV